MFFNPPDPQKLWLTAQEAAKLLGVDVDLFREWVKEGKIPGPGVRHSRETVFWAAEVIAAVGVLLAFLLEPEERVKSKPDKPTEPNRG